MHVLQYVQLYMCMKQYLLLIYAHILQYNLYIQIDTVEPLYNGQVGSGSFVLYMEVVLFQRLQLVCPEYQCIELCNTNRLVNNDTVVEQAHNPTTKLAYTCNTHEMKSKLAVII